MRGETITLIHRVKAGEDPGGGIKIGRAHV